MAGGAERSDEHGNLRPPDRRDLKTIGDLAQSILADRAHPRFQPRSLDAEAPREVFIAAADAIGARYARDGWRYARSGPHLTKRFGRAAAKAHIGSSHNNLAGEVVLLHVAITITDKRHRDWRAAVGLTDWEQVSARQLGNLADPHRWIEWNLADRARRPATIADIIDTIDELGMPYVQAVTAAIDADPFDAGALYGLVDPDVEAEYRVRFGDLPGAETAIRTYLSQSNDGMRDSFRRALGEYRRGSGLHLQPSSVGAKLARLVLTADLQVD